MSPRLSSEVFHNSAEAYRDYSNSRIQAYLDEEVITKEDARLLRRYVNEKGLKMGPQLQYKHYVFLTIWRKFIGPYTDNTIDEINEGLNNIRYGKNNRNQPYSQHTIHDLVKFLKRFYLWMIDEGYSSIDRRKIERISPPPIDQMRVTAEDLLTEEEIMSMIKACKSTRDRAMISMLYEGGFRIQEIGTLQWKQIKNNKWNIVINTAEKTKKPRYIPLVMSKPYLAQWMNDYPYEPTGDHYVFIPSNGGRSRKGKDKTEIGPNHCFNYRGLYKRVSLVVKDAGITKKVYPHLFRHSRITHLIQKGYNESVIKKMMWGNLNTDMFSVYAHLTDNDIDNEIMRQEGIIDEEEQKASPLEARQCPECYTVNAPTARVCSVCLRPLTEEAKAERKEVLSLISNLSDDEVIELIRERGIRL